MAIDNDTRGWIMACISGVACVLGASVICVDIILRLIPGWHDFSISESDQFLSASLSLSFGVMLFSALYSMLPQSKTYLKDAGYSPRTASFILIGLFLAGVIGIRVLSRIIHQFIPSHVVDCDHTHDEEEAFPKDREEMEDHLHGHEQTNGFTVSNCRPQTADDEDTPLLLRSDSFSPKKRLSETQETVGDAACRQSFVTAPSSRRPSFMPKTLTRTFSKYVSGWKENCDEMGPCMGFSDPCGQDCFKVVHRRGSILPGHGPFTRAPTWRTTVNDVRVAPLAEEDERTSTNSSTVPPVTSHTQRLHVGRSRSSTHHFHHIDNGHQEGGLRRPSHHSHHSHNSHHSHQSSSAVGQEHHHHVPTNAFMSIGLQTSIAIALHKAPEGFITYATNHANPQLGFAVFMALFIHNITEGYAMSLPLYLALDSRFKAIVWSSFLGGASQPLGAGIAALWFKVANRTSMGAPTEGVYGGMFAVTAGVMTSVALSLFSESLSLSHNKGTCIAFAFLGMGILGFSFALTAS